MDYIIEREYYIGKHVREIKEIESILAKWEKEEIEIVSYKELLKILIVFILEEGFDIYEYRYTCDIEGASEIYEILYDDKKNKDDIIWVYIEQLADYYKTWFTVACIAIANNIKEIIKEFKNIMNVKSLCNWDNSKERKIYKEYIKDIIFNNNRIVKYSSSSKLIDEYYKDINENKMNIKISPLRRKRGKRNNNIKKKQTIHTVKEELNEEKIHKDKKFFFKKNNDD